MLAALDAPYADARADGLAFALGLPPLDALAVLPVERAGLTVQLRLLGASHQIIAGPLSETVACLPGAAGPLPGRAATTLPGWSYEFTATTAAHRDATAFGRAVDAVRDRLADRHDALTGAFPGSPHAVTALALDAPLDTAQDATGLGWRTWHAYPQTREIVMTRSLLVRPR
ncbi:DUF2617 family protein [Actinomadura roseirufa]|uniref:DUF2617 family protein n=1 Tax=Actinomadura roseirufa TaxID=2094049 RepID=UPI0010410C1D|nr:DUF2617 family protein [Actinomadura roseirufa]